MSASITLIVPVKSPDSGKSRLAPALGPAGRRALSLMLLDHVLTCASSASVSLRTWVVSGDHRVRRLASERGVLWLPELGHDLNQTLWLAMQRAFQEGSDAAIFLPADLPFLTVEDVAALVEALATRTAVVLCPAERDGGTNALAMPQALAFPPRLGASSFARHLEELRRLGHPYAVLQRPGLAFDLDTPDDLAHCRSHMPGFDRELARWQATLQRTVASAPWNT